MTGSVIVGILFWMGLLSLLILVRPGAGIHRTGCSRLKRKHYLLIFTVMVVWIAGMAKVMSLPPNWNGENPEHKDQYERITEAFLNGHLFFDYDDVDPKLNAMENPYDREARDREQVYYHWDHAFYNGHYYMYFGVVPVFLLFLPFRVITGYALPTLYATQIFAAGFTIGIFALFWNLTKKFFQDLPLSIYLDLALILSFTCLRYTIKFPILYQTAVSAGLCLAIWSMFCFTKAVWTEKRENKAILLAALGSLLGALVFGCRPTIALGNLVVIPLLITFLKGRQVTIGLILRLAAAALPYVVVAALLMIYNRARFGNPFELGQSYQLTITDQSSYGSFWTRLDPAAALNGIIFSFAQSPTVSVWLSHGGVLWECPILVLGFAACADQLTKRKIRENHLSCFLLALLLTSVLIVVFQTAWSPKLLYRYCEDYLWLLVILLFFAVGFRHQEAEKPERYAGGVCWLSVASFFVGCLIILIQEEGSLTATQPELIGKIVGFLSLGTHGI